MADEENGEVAGRIGRIVEAAGAANVKKPSTLNERQQLLFNSLAGTITAISEQYQIEHVCEIVGVLEAMKFHYLAPMMQAPPPPDESGGPVVAGE